MAIPNNYIDKITNNDPGESRIISPAADKVRVENENFEGADLDEVLDEVAQAIEDAGSGDGTVTGVKVGSTTYEPTEGVVDISPAIPDTSGLATKTEVTQGLAGKVDKVTGYGLSKNDYSDADKTKLAGIETGAEKNVINGIKANGASETLPVENGIVTLPPAASPISPATAAPLEDGTAGVGSSEKYAREDHRHPHDTSKLSKSDVSVETQGDGTVDINVKDDTYTINLNHTHENMAKIVKCTEATLPQTLENDTIYVQVDNATTPTEIESLYLFGLEFTGGGAAPGTPRLTSPSQTHINNGIDIGNTTSGTVSYPITIKAKDLTQSLIVEWGNGSTGYSFDTSDLPSGVTYDSGTGKLTITKDAACSVNGIDITVVYTGSDSDENAEGTLGISSSSVDGINVEVPLIANKVEYVALSGVKLTGTQRMVTDWNLTAKTDFSMKVKLDSNSYSDDYTVDQGNHCYLVGTQWDNNTATNNYYIAVQNQSGTSNKKFIFRSNKTSQQGASNVVVQATSITEDNSVISFLKNGTFSFTPGNGTAITGSTGSAVDRSVPICIGSLGPLDSAIFWKYNATIYEITITEDNVVKRHYLPCRKDGVPGMRDEVTGHFMGSASDTELEEVLLTSNN